jgi:hypothetical protein
VDVRRSRAKKPTEGVPEFCERCGAHEDWDGRFEAEDSGRGVAYGHGTHHTRDEEEAGERPCILYFR